MSDSSNYTATFRVESPYMLPQAVTVEVGGSALTQGTDYTYAAGVLTVPAEKITGDMTITAEGLLPSATPTADVTTVEKTASPQKEVVFALTNDPAYADRQTWMVYAAETGDTLAAGVTASNVGNTLTLSHVTDVPATDYWVSVTETNKAESARLKLTVGAYVAPSVLLGTDKTVTVNFEYADAGTATKEDSIQITTVAGTGVGVTFAFTDFSLSGSATTSAAIAGASVTAIGQTAAGSTTLTIQIAKSVAATNAYLWYKSAYVGAITISKSIAAPSTDAELTALSYKVDSDAAVTLGDTERETAATSAGLNVTLPYGTYATASITLDGTCRSAYATISGGTGQLSGGSKSIILTVTAQDGTTTQDYKINFTTQGKTAAPAFSAVTDTLTAADDVTATFTLTNAIAGGTYRVYDVSTGGTAIQNLMSVSGNTVTLTLGAPPAAETKYHISVQSGSDVESDRTEVTINPYVAPSVTLGTDKTVTVGFDYADADTVTKEDTIQVTTVAGTGTGVRFAYTDFSLSSSDTISDATTAIAGTSVTAIGQTAAGSTTLTIQIAKSLDASVTFAYLWYKTSYIGAIAVAKTVDAPSADAALTELSYTVDSVAAVTLGDTERETAATNAGVDVMLPYGTSPIAVIELLGSKRDANASISGGTGQLSGGSKSITLTVTAQDGTTKKNYTINFTTQGKTAPPAFSPATDTLTAADDVTATFTLTNAVTGGTYRVYDVSTGGSALQNLMSVSGNTVTLTLGAVPTTETKYHISAQSGSDVESERTEVTIYPYVAPSVVLDADKTVTVNFEYADAGTATKEDTIQITTVAGTGVGVTFDFTDFSLSSSNTKNDTTTDIAGASVTAIGQAGAGSTTLTISIAKSVTAPSAYLWYGGRSVGQINIDKTVAAPSTDATLTELSYKVDDGAETALTPSQLATAETSAGFNVELPYGTSASASITLDGTCRSAYATISGGTGQLSGGSKSITLTVTAQDGTTKKNYTINFTTRGKTAAPAFSPATDTLTAADDVTATFTLTYAIAGGTYRVYDASTGGSAIQNMLTISSDTVTLTLSAPPTGETKYYISAQSGSDVESERTEVTLYPYVAPVITFTTQPQDATVTVGRVSGSLTASASVSTSGAATLDWYACDASGAISGTSLYTGGAFAIPTNLTQGDHYYLCRATYPGAAAKDSDAAKVSVLAQALLNIGILPSGTIIHGAADETVVTIGAGVPGFDISNFDATNGVQISYENGPFKKLSQGDECDVATGSIKVTLHKAYLNTLAAGRYTLRVHLTGAGYPPYVETTLTVLKHVKPPQTGDSASPWLWLLLCLLGGAGLLGAVKRLRRA